MSFLYKIMLSLLFLPQFVHSIVLGDIIHLGVGSSCLVGSCILGNQAKKEYDKENTPFKRIQYAGREAVDVVNEARKQVDTFLSDLLFGCGQQNKKVENNSFKEQLKNVQETTEKFAEKTYKSGERWWNRYHKTAKYGIAAVVLGFFGFFELRKGFSGPIKVDR